jgi:hypothetical protein
MAPLECVADHGKRCEGRADIARLEASARQQHTKNHAPILTTSVSDPARRVTPFSNRHSAANRLAEAHSCSRRPTLVIETKLRFRAVRIILDEANAVFSLVTDSGLIGNWSPGIGDPSIMGWFTVVLYFYTGYRCFRLTRDKNVKLVRRERSFWTLFTLALVALGINKQLDLQSAVTEIGRILARKQGWYEARRMVQAEFIGLVGVLGLVSIGLLIWITRRMPAATRIAVTGGAALVTFVVVRAVSFHHFDRLIGRSLFGMRFNWVFEIGSISIILAATYFRPLTDARRQVQTGR